MSDPYRPPSKEEVEQSGTADWVDQALDRHQQRQQKLSGVFSDAQKEMRMEKERLAGVWNSPASEVEEDRGPDLFAAERSKGASEKQKLASVWDADRAAREAEEDQLRNMFGSAPPKKRK